MTGDDMEFFRKCHELGCVKSPFLEIGSVRIEACGSISAADMAREAKVERVVGTDLAAGPGVDFAFDFDLPVTEFSQEWTHGEFSAVTIFNVLEHTFDPVQVLTNAASCVARGGHLLVVTPTVWPIHNFPRDCNRLLPDWYEEFARRNQMHIQQGLFCWISQFGIFPIDKLKKANEHVLPNYLNSGSSHPIRFWTSRFVHRILNPKNS